MNLRIETISEIKLNSNNELLLVLESGGRSEYQYIYRTATSISWLSDSASFKFGPLRDWSVSEAFFHVKESLRKEGNLELILAPNIKWENINLNERKSNLKGT